MCDNKYTFTLLKRLAETIPATFGKQCCVLIYDCTQPDKPVYQAGESLKQILGATDNGGRIEFLLSCPAQEVCGERLYMHNKQLIISTLTFPGLEGQPGWRFCILLDITPIQQAIDALQGYGPASYVGSYASIAQVPASAKTLESILAESLRTFPVPVKRMNMHNRLALVTLLHKQDFFSMKGAVVELAKALRVSRYTIYNDLKRLDESPSQVTFITEKHV